MVEFNLRQGGMTVHEYSLKFTKLSKYAPSLVSNTREEMRRFVTRVSYDLQEECHSTMLHQNMNLSCHMVHVQHKEEVSSNTKSRDVNRVRSFDGGSSKGRLDINDNSRFKKRSYNQVPAKYPNIMMIGFLTLSLKGGMY